MNKRLVVLVVSIIALVVPLAGSAGARLGWPLTQDSPVPLEASPPLEGEDTPAAIESTLAAITSRVSVSSNGAEGNDESTFPALSYDGRYVAFSSDASNLVANDTNSFEDIFVHDRQTGQTQRISVGAGGQEGNGESWSPAISSTGRYIAFSSFASNFVSGDTNNASDIFVMDRDTGVLQRVSVSSSEVQTIGGSHDPAISANGRYIAFYSGGDLTNTDSDTNGAFDVYVRDTVDGETWRVSVSTAGAEGNNHSWGRVSISADGRRVGFASWASTLVANDTNGMMDVFVHDWYNGWTVMASVSPSGAIGNGNSSGILSGNGRYMAFNSDASNLISNDTNEASDAFVHDLDTGLMERVSISSSGEQVYGGVYSVEISHDGRLVVFHSSASSLVSDDTNGYQDIFVHDRDTGLTDRVSVTSTGTQGNDNAAILIDISGDNRFVAFTSQASNLVANDGNGVPDVFIRDFGPCYALTLQKQSGQGDPPQATTQEIGCQSGAYHAGEAITLTANPASGWHVAGWEGTNNDTSTSTINTINMPAGPYQASVIYAVNAPAARTAFLPSVVDTSLTCFAGPGELEPNNSAAQSNGPLCAGLVFTGLPDRYDVFYIDAAAGPIMVNLTNYLGSGVQLQLHHQTITPSPIAIDYNGADGYGVELSNAPAGRYYVVISNAQPDPGATTRYTLTPTFNISR